jgi:DNA uptake protein ComE-like DNA-binding protein
MNWKQFYDDYLTFTKKDRIGLLFIISIIVFFLILPRFITQKTSINIKENPLLLAAIDTLQYRNSIEVDDTEKSDLPYISKSRHNHFTKAKPFYFDPNTATAEDWKRLGLEDRTIKTILNFRSKGGRFYRNEDLKKIWGLPKGFYEHVADYISIVSIDTKQRAEQINNSYKKEKKTLIVHINDADTTAWMALPGIGIKLASRITNFREKLGGFYSIEQVGETYGVPDSTFQKIKKYLNSDGIIFRKININTATKDELKSHPYIKWNVANAIIEYRNQHGSYKSLFDLKNIVLIDDPLWNKITPYLSL